MVLRGDRDTWSCDVDSGSLSVLCGRGEGLGKMNLHMATEI